MKSLINKVVRITSDNENYKEYLDKELIIVESYFQEDRDDEPMYDLDIVNSIEVFPFSLYEWEFELV